MAQPIATDTVDYNVVYRFFSWFGNKIKDTFNAAVDTVKGWLGLADEAPALPEQSAEVPPAVSESTPDIASVTEVAGAVLEPEWLADHENQLDADMAFCDTGNGMVL